MREHMGLYRGRRSDNGAWVDNGEWVEGAFCPRNSRKNSPCIIKLTGAAAGYWYEVDPDTVGECTGLRDKNGKLIFEGDMCCNTRTGEIVSVKWHGTMAGFVWSKRKEKSNLFDFGELFRAHDKYEIIGNIHDNPELLEGCANHAAD